MPTINDRALEAASHDVTEEVLRELAADRSPKVRSAVAGNLSTPVDVLRRLVEDPKPNVRFAVADNPNRQACEIALGASDKQTRGLAAQRGDLDADALEQVLSDPEHSVRECLAGVVVAPDVVAALARDPHPAVRAAILHNPALIDADVEMLARDAMARVRGSAASSRRPRPETLARLAEDRSSSVRWHVLTHNPERLDLARQLLADTDDIVRGQAEAQLRNPRTFTGAFGYPDLIE